MYDSNTAYVIGVAIGDGNLSNPNGRATRLRITCDSKYPMLVKKICESLHRMLPKNRISILYTKGTYLNISCYSNQLENILGWKAGMGPKYIQKVRIPSWIFQDKSFILNCLRGLIETDGSVFKDRTYTHVNFTTIIPELALDVEKMLQGLGYAYSIQRISEKHPKKPKFVIRICKRSEEFIRELEIDKR